MRIFYSLFLLGLFIASNLKAQTPKSNAAQHLETFVVKNIDVPTIVTTTCDSIGWRPPVNYSFVYSAILNSAGGGYVGGANGYGDKEKANYWDVSANSGTFLSKIILGIGISNGPDLSKVVNIKVYDGTSGVPGTLLGQIPSTMQIMRAATGLSIFQFTPAIVLPASKKIFISVDVSALSWTSTTNAAVNDSLAVLSTRFDEPAINQGWEKWSNNSWVAMNNPGGWNARVNFHIYPLVSTNANCTLPVSFGALKGQLKNNTVQLLWKTYAEANSDGFEIERSSDGTKFIKVGLVNSKANNGTGFGPFSYSFTDVDPSNNNVYRIKQFDKDGRFSYSNTIIVNKINPISSSINNLYPNPVGSTLNINLNKALKGNAMVQILDATGKIVLAQTISVSNRSNISLNTGNQKAGFYTLKMIEENGTISLVKFLKQ